MQQELNGNMPVPVSRDAGTVSVIALAGLIAGILDISDALVFYGFRGVQPIRILQSIASGLLGIRAYQGGWKTATLGLALHFLIAFTAAAVYYFMARKADFLRRWPILSGLLYGGVVYVVMNYVVLPLSAFPKRSHPPSVGALVNGVLAVVLLVGLPIALTFETSLSRPDE